MEKPIAQRLAERLKVVMDSKGVNNSGLAELLGVNRSNITRYLSGKHAPSGATLETLSQALGVDVCELICETRRKK
jgi:transcriptional regulator with XRE-family HTH domain